MFKTQDTLYNTSSNLNHKMFLPERGRLGNARRRTTGIFSNSSGLYVDFYTKVETKQRNGPG